MFWFVAAVVLTMIAIIDLTTNLHALVLRRLARRQVRIAPAEIRRWHRPIEVDPSVEVDQAILLRALHETPAA